jgi:hypothetical protein
MGANSSAIGGNRTEHKITAMPSTAGSVANCLLEIDKDGMEKGSGQSSLLGAWQNQETMALL